LQNLATKATINVDVPDTKSVHVLINADYLSMDIAGKQVGEIILAFANNKTFAVPITAWQTVRSVVISKENEYLMEKMIAPPDNIKFENVYIEKQARGGKPFLGYTDMLTIELPRDLIGETLKEITITDTSFESINSLSPSLVIVGITVESM
jgi:hypothetical protein